MPTDAVKTGSPSLPWLLAGPLSLLPDTLHSRLMARVLNKVLAAQIDAGELDFLDQRTLAIRVRDAAITFRLALQGGRLVKIADKRACDLSIAATAYDFLALIGRVEDPDSLVFQRRLVMQGDTELGLEVKNFLDGLDVESHALYRKAEPLLRRMLALYTLH